ncbi:MAG: thymidine phosphorylase [Opitutales bacterium]|nr:thymidine phosphorylase [Opitutales bacterium]
MSTKKSTGNSKKVSTNPAVSEEKIEQYAALIAKKRDGNEFTKPEIRTIVDAIMKGDMPVSQQSALLMAIYFKSLSGAEMAAFSEEMMFSGTTMDIEFAKITDPKVSKTSTGGVGDKVSLALAVVGAANDVVVPMMVSQDESTVISLIDKVKAIPGFNTEYSHSDYAKLIGKVGTGIVRKSEDISPVDGALSVLRKETVTDENLHLLTCSILSRKYAEDSDGLIIDLKWGSGSYVHDLEQAKLLARFLTRVAKGMKRKSVALVTDANQPLGDMVGTGMEIIETVQILCGCGLNLTPKSRYAYLANSQELLQEFGKEMVRLAGVAGSTLSAKQMVERTIRNRLGLKKFKEMIEKQGGSTEWLTDLVAKYDAAVKAGAGESFDWLKEQKLFKPATKVKHSCAAKRGYVHQINPLLIAKGVYELARRKDGTLDPAVGVCGLRKVGYQVKQGEALFEIRYNDEANLARAMEYFRYAYRLAPKRPVDLPLIAERVA